MSVSATYLYPVITAWRTREYTPNISELRDGAQRVIFASGLVVGDASGNTATVNLIFDSGYFQNRAMRMILFAPLNNDPQAAGSNYRMIVSIQEQAMAIGYNWMAEAESEPAANMSGAAGRDILQTLWVPPHDGATSLVCVGQNINGVVFQAMAMLEVWDTPAVAKA